MGEVVLDQVEDLLLLLREPAKEVREGALRLGGELGQLAKPLGSTRDPRLREEVPPKLAPLTPSPVLSMSPPEDPTQKRSAPSLHARRVVLEAPRPPRALTLSARRTPGGLDAR